MTEISEKAPSPEPHGRIEPLTRTQIEMLASNILAVNNFYCTVDWLTYHLSRRETETPGMGK